MDFKAKLIQLNLEIFMTLLSASKLSESINRIKISILVLSILSLSSIFPSSVAFANSCSKSDIDYYLQRGFTNAQVVQLCAGPATTQNTGQTYQAPSQSQIQQNQQSNQLREDQSYLSAALDADGITMTSQGITLLPRECIEYGSNLNNVASGDTVETICVGTKLQIEFSGIKVNKAKKGIFLVRDSTVHITGNIKRDFIGINDLRRQDREAILETLSGNPTEVKLKVRRGINPNDVAQRLRKHAK